MKLLKTSLLALLILFSCCIDAAAQHVSMQTARQQAADFLSQQTISRETGNTGALANTGGITPRRIRSAADVMPVAMAEVMTAVDARKQKGMPAGLQTVRRQSRHTQTAAQWPFYIFSGADGRGYVIVSSDERTRTILGYSATEPFDAANIPEGLLAMLTLYADEIGSLPGGDDMTTAEASGQEHLLTMRKEPRKSKEDRTEVAPMVECQWGQEAPYNALCPMNGNRRCIVGCAATSMAQVMYYWGHQRGVNITSAAIPAYTTRTLKLQMPALAPATFDWAAMKPQSTTDAAAAKISFYAGCALEMDYGVDLSEAWGTDIGNAFRDYFGFDRNVRLVYRQDYDFDDYEQLVYDELAERRPVVLLGSFITDDGMEWGGHAFVCDGYQKSTGLFHVNWGWDGQNDNYFALTALNGVYTQGSQEGCFNLYQSCIVGIQPPVEGHDGYSETDRAAVVDMSITGAREFSRDSRSDDFTGIAIFNSVYNHLQHDGDLEAGIGLFDADNTLLSVVAETPLGYYMRTDGFGIEFTFGNCTFGHDLPAGTYYLRSISRAPESAEWQLSTNADHSYITAQMDEHSLVLQPSVDVAITSVKKNGSNYNVSYTGTLVNRGSEESRGVLYVFNEYKLINVIQTDIKAGETKQITLSYRAIEKICADYEGHHVIWSNGSTVPDIALTARAVDADRQGRFQGQTLRLDVSLANDAAVAYSRQVKVELFRQGESTAVATQTFTPSVAPKSTVTERISFEGLTYGQPYIIRLTSDTYTTEVGKMSTSQPRTFYVYTVTPVEPETLKGDINRDGIVTIADVTALVNIILGTSSLSSDDDQRLADVNGDGTVTIADVTALVNIILGKE